MLFDPYRRPMTYFPRKCLLALAIFAFSKSPGEHTTKIAKTNSDILGRNNDKKRYKTQYIDNTINNQYCNQKRHSVIIITAKQTGRRIDCCYKPIQMMSTHLQIIISVAFTCYSIVLTEYIIQLSWTFFVVQISSVQ